MSVFFDSNQNASVRGYILRSLVKGYHFTCSGKALANKLISCGLVSEPDISEHLYYLEQKNLIEFSGEHTDAFNVLQKDETVRLTGAGIRFIENGGEADPGIDL